MTTKKWIVTKDDERPAGAGSGHCFYCPSKIGDEHAKGCVIRTRKYLLRMTVDLVVEYPEDWDPEDIEFNRNDGTWCQSNVLDELEALQKQTGCLCGKVHFEFIKKLPESN